jgi:hypothetical protein
MAAQLGTHCVPRLAPQLPVNKDDEQQAADLDGDLCGSNALGSGIQVAVQSMRRHDDGAAGGHVHPVLQFCFVHVLQGPLQKLQGIASEY